MYFASRMQAGRMLASQLYRKYEQESCAVVALSDGGVMVGSQIAHELHCVLTMLLTDEIMLPRETVAIAGITQDGSFSYNHGFSDGEIDEMAGEYFTLLEQLKREKMHKMHALLGKNSLINQELLRGKVVILASDGLKSGFALDLAMQYLKLIDIKKIVVATPFASVPAVDRMHILVDDIYCLDVLQDYISTDHYYENNEVPSHENVVSTIEKVIRDWA